MGTLTKHATTGIVLVLVIGAVGAGCSGRSQRIKRLKIAQQYLAQGDEAFRSGSYDAALSVYQRANDMTKKVGDPGTDTVIAETLDRVSSEVALRMGAYESPSKAIVAMFRLAADDETRELAENLWFDEHCAAAIVGQDRWESLSDSTRCCLCDCVCWSARELLLDEKTLCQRIEFTFDDCGVSCTNECETSDDGGKQ